MASPYKAVNLILNNGDTILQNVSEIDKLNENRKYLTEQFYKDALQKVNSNDNILFYISKDVDH
jgi:single-stranded DNA-specific DHH superfamily exonuclease